MIETIEFKIENLEQAFDLLEQIIARNLGVEIAKEDKRPYFLASDYINEHLEKLTIEQIERLCSEQFHQGQAYLKIKTVRLKEKRLEYYIKNNLLCPTKIDLDGIKREKKDALVYQYLKVLYQKPNSAQFKYLMKTHENTVLKSFEAAGEMVPMELVKVMMEFKPGLIFERAYSQNYSDEESQSFFKTVWDKKFNNRSNNGNNNNDSWNDILKETAVVTNDIRKESLDERKLELYLDYLIERLDKNYDNSIKTEEGSRAYFGLFLMPQFLEKINNDKPELIRRILSTKVKIINKAHIDEWGTEHGKRQTVIINMAQNFFTNNDFYFEIDLDKPSKVGMMFFKLFEDIIMDNKCSFMEEFLLEEIDFFDYLYKIHNSYRQITLIDFDKLDGPQKDKYIAKIFFLLNLDLKELLNSGYSTLEEMALLKWATERVALLDLDKVMAMYKKTKDEHNSESHTLLQTLELKHQMNETLNRPGVKTKSLKV